MNIWLATRSQIQSICENLPRGANFVVENQISNWAQLVIISFSSAVRVAKRYSKNQNVFVGFFGNVEKDYGEKLDSVKNCFHILPWTNVKEQES